MAQRIVEIKKDDQWTRVTMAEVKTGDTFRLFEPDGEPVEYKGATDFVATEDAKLMENGVYGVEIED